MTYKRDGIPYSSRQEYDLINLIDNEAKRKKKGEQRANRRSKLNRQANEYSKPVHGTNTMDR
ncbi:hypothetical protein [Fructilactobacillus sanfranciscensis]|uniref:hypothetical protein n=1 Tax=Fructilactobacillus sanfranciscensis TaxID=1625 RepID=UPI000CD45FDA|nr:hypothetical protein [Fructilactobacillus sanfranciscensis]POH18753.1 hypothetical protein BGL45_06320 [Fructilactobacillus sanfranciscensis]